MRGAWKTWMNAWCWVVLAFGAVLALVATPATDGPGRFVFALISRDPASDAVLGSAAMRFAVGLQGALTMGWALTIFAAVRAAEICGAPVWRSLTLSLAFWYVTDSAISVATGFPMNAVSNTILMAAFLAPVVGSGVLGGRTAAV